MKNEMVVAAAAAALLFGAALPPAAAVEPVAAVSTAATARDYKRDAAQHIYGKYRAQIYKGKLPPLVHAIVVCETEVGADGEVREVKMVRVPSHAPDVVVRVREMIRAASPMPQPQKLGSSVRFLEIWLVDKSGRFQLDTLTEGQL